jgi:hypothetical protein
MVRTSQEGLSLASEHGPTLVGHDDLTPLQNFEVERYRSTYDVLVQDETGTMQVQRSPLSPNCLTKRCLSSDGTANSVAISPVNCRQGGAFLWESGPVIRRGLEVRGGQVPVALCNSRTLYSLQRRLALLHLVLRLRRI